ncbi:MAG: metalloprotease TldD [Pseudomonadota bacterium]
MSDLLQQTDHLFFDKTGMDKESILKSVGNTLNGGDDGELFLEYRLSESLVWDDGHLKSASYDTDQGFGLRAVAGDSFGFAHSSEFSEQAIKRAGETVRGIYQGYGGTMAAAPVGTNRHLYTDNNPLAATSFEKKVQLLETIDQYLRDKDPAICQVSASLSGSWQAVQILRAGGFCTADIRPMVRLNISVVVEKDGRMESGNYGFGGRKIYDDLFVKENWQHAADEALREAHVNLDARPAPAGEMTVVLGNGWPGVLLHEAVGHGLEGDFNRKKSSSFSGRMGDQVAAKGVTVVDDGTMTDLRGSITVDDEGTPSRRNVLIEDGKLVGYMQDRMNARLMGMEPTGNGRRESYAYHPMPRMTNTFMEAGQHDPSEIIQSVKNGIYAANFGGGQVDITSGKFVFEASEAYLIENGKVTAPVKGATLIGNGFDVMNKISMIGNDLALDPGIGVCGKDGQGVPAGVGQPTCRVDGVTVGGTETG